LAIISAAATAPPILICGVFASPFILIDNEPFRGNDGFEDSKRLYDR
jgi:hypothetical protein